MNLPNALTALRIFLVPWLVVLLLTRTEWGWFLGLVVFTLAVITDYFDGWFARRRNQQTKLGAMLDPLADKLLLSAAFISLIEMEKAPAWIVAVILGREFAVTWLRGELLGRGVVMSASAAGKAKTVAQIVPGHLRDASGRAGEVLRPARGPLPLRGPRSHPVFGSGVLSPLREVQSKGLRSECPFCAGQGREGRTNEKERVAPLLQADPAGSDYGWRITRSPTMISSRE